MWGRTTPTEVHGAVWESSAAGMGRGSAPSLSKSHRLWYFVFVAEIYMSFLPSLWRGRWLLTETAKPVRRGHPSWA